MQSENRSMKTIKINSADLSVKVVSKPEEMAKGLMDVTKMPKNEGMLFCYPEEKILSFWMKSTPIPLSIAFIDKNKKIIQIEEMKPFDETSINSDRPAMWALEVNSGWFDENKIKIGDTVSNISNKFIKIKIVKLPPEAKKLAKEIEDKLVTMTAMALKTKLGVDAKLKNIHVDVSEEKGKGL